MSSNSIIVVFLVLMLLTWPRSSEGRSSSSQDGVALSQIVLKAYLIDIEQLKGLYKSNAPPLEQKRERDLIGRRYFLVVEVQNSSDTPVKGKFTVKYEATTDYRIAEVVRLEAHMDQPDYFIWREGGARFMGRKTPPNLSVEWMETHAIK